MKILQVSHRFLPRYLAGVEVYTAHLSRGLAARGHAVQIFTGDPEANTPSTTTWEGLPVHVQPWGWPAGRGAVGTFLAGLANPPVERQFGAVLRDFQPEVVHVQHLLGLSPALIGLAHAAGARVVATLHDYWFVCSNTWLFRWHRARCSGPGWGYHCGGCALHRLGRRPQPALMILAAPLFWLRTRRLAAALAEADLLIAPSEAVARAHQDLGLPAARLRRLPHGLAEAGPSAPRVERAPGPLRAMYLGSLIPPKGVHVAIAAFNDLDDPQARLDIYGDEQADPAYAAELRALARHPGIAFHGPLARADVPAVMARADLLLAPSIWLETYGIVIDEARQAGLAVLVAAGGALAEKIRPDEEGLLAAPGDVPAWRAQLQRCAREPELLARLRAAAHEPFTLAQHVAAVEVLYAEGQRGLAFVR